MSTKQIKVYKDLMGENEKWANKIRTLLAEYNVTMLNLIGSPGSGKTALLETAGKQLSELMNFSVLEGDVKTTRDAQRLLDAGVDASQLLSGGACHLEAKLVFRAINDLKLTDLDMVIVENVGNLVCPAEFDIGEYGKVAVLSVTEGEDKPLKYPLLFQECKAVLLTKMDLVKYLDFNVSKCESYIKRINSGCKIFKLSSLNGEGITEWLDWIKRLAGK
jgi:hydrogenase nickel incorporation protein HypB